MSHWNFFWDLKSNLTLLLERCVENKSQSCPVPYQILSEKAAEFMQINLRTEDWMETPPATSRFQPIDAGGLKSWLHNVLETFAKCIFANYVVHLH